MGQSTTACEQCRRRKVKCDKLKPCTNCRRQKISCHTTHEGVRPRGHFGGRGGNKDSIQARLARLEELLTNLNGSSTAQQQPTPEASEETQLDEKRLRNDADDLHRYVAGPIWSQLSEQIEGLRDVLLSSSDEDDAHPEAASTELSPFPTHVSMLLGSNFPNFGRSLISFAHPPFASRERLLVIFCNNVDPIFKIVHRPTMFRQLVLLDDVGHESPDTWRTHAIFFAIYAAAIMTLSAEECTAVTGLDRDNNLQYFVSATEYCLSKADYLNSRSLDCFQAFIIYILVTRVQDAGQKHWVLLGLAVQLARGLGLNSARTTNTFRPLQRELRLRLWQVLRNLDFRASIDRGVSPIIQPDTYDTPCPTNLNDADLVEDMIELPAARHGITDVSFGAVPDKGITLAAKLQYLDSEAFTANPQKILVDRLKLVQEFDDRINADYLIHCDMNVPMQWTMRYTAYALSRLCQLLAVRPMSRVQNLELPTLTLSSHDVLDRALQSLRAEELFFQSPLVKGFWWCTWNQWYVLAVALVEICAVPDLCRDAETWAVLQQAYDRQSTSIADTAHGRLWRPMKKLMKRVQGLREAQLSMPATAKASNIPLDQPSDTVIQTGIQESLFFADSARVTDSDAAFFDFQPQSMDDFDRADNSMAFWDDFLKDLTTLSPSECWSWDV